LQGATGPTGAQGPIGPAGAAGSSVSITPMVAGDPHCPNGGTMFTLNGAASYACNGGPRTICPDGFERRGAICIETQDHLATFTEAADFCNQIGAHLPSAAEMRAAIYASPSTSGGFAGDWVADNVAADQALYVADPNALNPIASASIFDSNYARCLIRIE